jgi:4-amino-4-deoxy-L-arabinose transferase-like glycosyltransferase
VLAVAAVMFFQRISPEPPVRAAEPGQWSYSPEVAGMAKFDELRNAGQTMLHLDEPNGIFPSMFWEPFIHRQFDSPMWGTNFWTLTQPPLMRYLIGFGRSAGGYGPDALPTYWDYSVIPPANAARGAVPSNDLLWWSRLPMAVLSIFSTVVLFWFARRCFGHLAAWIFLAAYLFNPFIKDCLSRAMTEPPMVFFLVAAMVLIVASVRAFYGRRLPAAIGWSALAGLSIGLAASAKLNAMAGLVALGLVCVVAVLRPNAWSWPSRAAYVVAAPALAGVLAFAIFFAINPFLYPDPFGRTSLMIENRVSEMSYQVAITPERAITGWGRVTVPFVRLFDWFAPLRFTGAQVLNFALAVVGAVWILLLFVRWLRREHEDPAPLVLGAFLGVVALPNLLTPIDWDRYFLWPEFYVTLFFAAGLAITLRGLTRRLAFLIEP